MEFEFGTNWATYSRYGGDVFGSALASEGAFAFFLECGFLAALLFGWDRIRREFLDENARGVSHRWRRGKRAYRDYGFWGRGFQSVLNGPVFSHAVRCVAGRRISGCEPFRSRWPAPSAFTGFPAARLNWTK